VGIAIATRGRPDSTRAAADSQRWFAPCRYPINPRSLLQAPHTAWISLVIFSTVSPQKCIGSYIAVILYPLIRIFTLVPAVRSHVARHMPSIFSGPPAWYRKGFRYSMPTHPPSFPVSSLLDQLLRPDSTIPLLGILSWNSHLHSAPWRLSSYGPQVPCH
jgi:hypothetical protein